MAEPCWRHPARHRDDDPAAGRLEVTDRLAHEAGRLDHVDLQDLAQVASHSSSSASIGVSGMMAALLTSTSMRPRQATASRQSLRPAPGSVKSACTSSLRSGSMGRRLLDARQVAGVVGDERGAGFAQHARRGRADAAGGTRKQDRLAS